MSWEFISMLALNAAFWIFSLGVLWTKVNYLTRIIENGLSKKVGEHDVAIARHGEAIRSLEAWEQTARR